MITGRLMYCEPVARKEKSILLYFRFYAVISATFMAISAEEIPISAT